MRKCTRPAYAKENYMIYLPSPPTALLSGIGRPY